VAADLVTCDIMQPNCGHLLVSPGVNPKNARVFRCGSLLGGQACMCVPQEAPTLGPRWQSVLSRKVRPKVLL
jgi:hypothetical protein